MSLSVRAGLAAAALLFAEPAALAFCGFFVSGAGSSLYNNASQVVLLRNTNYKYNAVERSHTPWHSDGQRRLDMYV